MAEPFPFEITSNEWRNYLQDINFWLNGYLNTTAYLNLEEKLDQHAYVRWNFGVGPTACFTRALSSITREVKKMRKHPPFDHVIEVDMKQRAVLGTASLTINDRLHIKVAEQLGLLDEEYDRLREKNDDQQYYSYTYDYSYNYNTEEDATFSIQHLLTSSIVPQIIQKLSTKRYLLVVENLDEPINRIKLLDFTKGLSLPPPDWKDSFWIISTTSQDVYSRSQPYGTIESFTSDDILMLTLYSLHEAARYIFGVIGHKGERYWHHVAIQCFHYATMLLIPHCSLAHADEYQQIFYGLADVITSDELIRQWAAQGLITVVQGRRGEVTEATHHGKYNDIYQVGNVIIEAFREYSLLHLPYSPATIANEATKSAAHFLAYHSLIAEDLTADEELFDGNHPGLKRMQWISYVADHGWHVTRDWLSHGTSGPSSLIVRQHCSQQSMLFAKLDHLLAKFPCLLVLDLSYTKVHSLHPSVSCLQQLQLLYLSFTPLESLPPSVYYLQKLRLLSLRGCYNLASPFSFSDTEATVPENNINKMINLIHLDLSYSNVNMFHCEFFHHMPNLQELLFVKCSNLEELPPSIVALSSLTTLELTGTQMKSFPGDMFEEMKKLQSIKLIENNILLFEPRLASKMCGLTDLHVEGCESITEVEVTLESHPTLRSFTFIAAPHVRRLSLRGCRKLESVEIMDVDALEELDLSATAIKELPDNIPNLPQLRQLLLVGIPSLRRFPWHKLQRLPDMFCLDQFSDRTIVNHTIPQVAQVCISDSRLFYSFSYHTFSLVRDGKLLKSFYVRITSCKATTRKTHDEENMVKTNRHQVSLLTYADVNHSYLTDRVSMFSMDDVPPFRETERHVEISTVDQYPHGLKYLLQVTKSISMSDDTHVSCLHDLSTLDELEECKLQRCHQMVRLFNDDVIAGGLQENLKTAYVSRLKSLTHFCIAYIAPPYEADFRALKHLHLEHCPRLEGVVSRSCALPSLVTLDILFCYNIKAIFHDNSCFRPRRDYQLPCLRRMHLHELPLLEHLHVDDPIVTAPKWEELHVRGCWSLRRLPRLSPQPDKASVKVSGEQAWWSKLRWGRDDGDGAPSHRGSYEPRLPAASASTRERIVIKTYLR